MQSATTRRRQRAAATRRRMWQCVSPTWTVWPRDQLLALRPRIDRDLAGQVYTRAVDRPGGTGHDRLCVEQQLDEIRQRVNTHDQAADRQGHDTATVYEVAALGERIRVLEDLVAQLVASVQAVVVPVQQTVATQQTMTGQLERLTQYQAEAATTRSHILGRLSHLEHEFSNICAQDLGHRSVQRACLSPTVAGLQEEHSHSSCCDKRVPCDLGASGTRQMGCGNIVESEEHPHGSTGAAECSEDAAAAALAVDLGLEGDLDDTAAWADYEDLEGYGREVLATSGSSPSREAAAERSDPARKAVHTLGEECDTSEHGWSESDIDASFGEELAGWLSMTHDRAAILEAEALLHGVTEMAGQHALTAVRLIPHLQCTIELGDSHIVEYAAEVSMHLLRATQGDPSTQQTCDLEAWRSGLLLEMSNVLGSLSDRRQRMNRSQFQRAMEETLSGVADMVGRVWRNLGAATQGHPQEER
jgi:hypothetical protein